MAEQAWFSADTADGSFAAPPPPPLPSAKAAYELRPLTAGELLDRTFYLYRANFWLFVGLASIASVVKTAVALVQIIYLHFLAANPAPGAAHQNPFAAGALYQTLGIAAFSIIASVLYLAVYSIIHAATTAAVTAIYLGDPTSMKQALNQVRGNWFRFILIGLWQIWSAMWLFIVLLFAGAFGAAFLATLMRGNESAAAAAAGMVVLLSIAGLVYGVIAYIRNSFAVPAAVMEGLKVRKAMRRSKQLTSGTKGRIFLLYLCIAALYLVAVAVQSPISIVLLQKKSTQVLLLQSISLFIGFFTSSVIGPVGALGICLFYIDQRIRKEGFDIEFLLERSGPVPPPFASQPLFQPLPPPEAPAALSEMLPVSSAEPPAHIIVEKL